MRDHIKIRQEYARLVRAGKLDEAQKIIRHIWNRENNKEIIIDKIIEKLTEDIQKTTVVEQPVITQKGTGTLDSLVRIKGIGRKTISDIKVMFEDVDSLISALKSDRVALRDDIVKKLREELVK